VIVDRLRRDLVQQVSIHLRRDADREYLDAGVLRRRRFGNGQLAVDVGRAVGDEDEDLGSAEPRAVARRKHLGASSLESRRDVRVTAADLQLPDGRQYRPAILVAVPID